MLEMLANLISEWEGQRNILVPEMWAQIDEQEWAFGDKKLLLPEFAKPHIKLAQILITFFIQNFRIDSIDEEVFNLFSKFDSNLKSADLSNKNNSDQIYFIQKQVIMNPNSRNIRDLEFSRIQDHNRYQNTDQLYVPLRRVLLTPGQVQSHYQYINPAASHSHVSQDYTYLKPDQIHEIREHTYIPINQELQATHDLSKVQGKQFMVVDANRRILGSPITSQQMDMIRAKGYHEEKVLYDFKPQGVEPLPRPSPYRPPGPQNFPNKDKYKYNLYSMIDEPMNLIKESGCGACTCPGNEIIASRNEPQSLGWFK